MFCGYDSYQALATIDESGISKLENFARHDLVDLLDATEFENFYGIYTKKPKLFKVAEGHKKILKIICDSARSYLEKQDIIKRKRKALDKICEKNVKLKIKREQK